MRIIAVLTLFGLLDNIHSFPPVNNTGIRVYTASNRNHSNIV